MKYLGVLLWVIALSSCNQAAENKVNSKTLISNVSIVDVRTGEIQEHRSIEIDSGIIQRITGVVKNTEGYLRVIDGKGMFVMPGLAEMHAHIPSPPVSQEQLEETLFH